MSVVVARRKPKPSAPFETSAYEEAEKLGLIGCIKGPSDLARNRKKYLAEILRAKHGRSR